MTNLRMPVSAPGNFRRSMMEEFSAYLDGEARRFSAGNRLRIDLHCHDLNSDVPDELWGRILGLPETWLKTKQLVKCLQRNGSDVITVTNHNNARSCWTLQEKGVDVLVAAEFTCHFPEVDLYSHVLTYGFTIAQEPILQRKRQNIYEFLRYTAEHNLPVILPHPLYQYARAGQVDPAVFEKLAVMFQQFEVLNGQRDLWQSTLTLNWAQNLTAEKIHLYAKRHRLNPEDFGVDPGRPKVLAGGSDDHMGIFAGQCGSYLEVPNLQQRLLTHTHSELALEAMRAGRIAPFGHVGENQKLNIALLDYFSQVATRIEDPGLLRILLHRGDTQDKLACLAISNVLLELQKHKHSRKFFEYVHEALQGKKPNKMMKWNIPKKYRFCVKHLEKIADSKSHAPEIFVATVNESIAELFTELNKIVIQKVQSSELLSRENRALRFSTEEITRNFEIPSQFSALLFGGPNKHHHLTGRKLQELLASVSFPLMVSIVLTGAALASTRVLYQNRQFLNDFATRLDRNHHDSRALHLTDTLFDRNGVSNSLGGKLQHIQANATAIDMLVCHETADPAPHLHVVRPLASFTLPDSGGQQLRIPDIMQIARIFYAGGYDRVVCSTEGPMVLVALLLKHMFHIPCYFFMHTDWIEYIKSTTEATQHERDRIRRLLRLLYKQFDGIFVLNSEHRAWLAGYQMELNPDHIYLTAHHAPDVETGVVPLDKRELFPDATEATPVLFIACRLSREKGLFDLPAVIARVRQNLPELKIVIAGSGPDEAELRALMPDALFLGWVDRLRLAQLYAGLDLFIFPSRFDTFGNVLLEAFVHGMPAVAYNCKGPRDIIEHGISGYLAEDVDQMALFIIEHYQQSDMRLTMRTNARRRAGDYNADNIMQRFVRDLGLPTAIRAVKQRSVA